MVGNVWEWTEDCYHDSYNGAPADGIAWTGGDCGGRRVVRGGSWVSAPQDLRSAYRSGVTSDGRNYNFGFRVGRTLVTP
jgi:formylglycine-generating enzyme required for sulfatase activity